MSVVNLVYLAKPVRGGWPTYTAHLAYGLQAAGHEVQLWRLSKHTEMRDRPFGRGLRYRNASLEFLTEITRQERTHITACELSAKDAVLALLRAGATVTVHDPTELKGHMHNVFRESKEPVVVIRSTMRGHFHGHAIPCRWVRHPYFRMPAAAPDRKFHAVAFSRLDWDKGTHHIVEANVDLPASQVVHLWGAENRMYAHHKIDPIDPGWRRYYHGQWPVDDLWGGVKIAQQAHYVVDLSAIKGDGGGTQYTFLEAIDAGATLILNQEWLKPDAQEMRRHAVFVDPEQLFDTLTAPPQTVNAAELLEIHDAKARALQTVGLA